MLFCCWRVCRRLAVSGSLFIRSFNYFSVKLTEIFSFSFYRTNLGYSQTSFFHLDPCYEWWGVLQLQPCPPSEPSSCSELVSCCIKTTWFFVSEWEKAIQLGVRSLPKVPTLCLLRLERTIHLQNRIPLPPSSSFVKWWKLVWRSVRSEGVEATQC